MPDAKSKLLDEALARFKLAAEAEAKQRERELADLRFVDFDEQWPDDVKAARQGFTPGGGMPAVPPRPCLTINKLLQPIEQVTNQARQARLALSFAPKGAGASQDTADAYEDIVRAIQADSRAHLARQWAFERAAKCGRGAYRILTAYENDGDFDLDIIYKRILNQATVYLDPSAQEPDWSDGEWAFVVEDMPYTRYKRLYPDSQLAQCEDDEFSSIGDDFPEWARSDDSKLKTVRIAEYWRVVYAKVQIGLYQMPDGSERTLEVGQQPPDARLVPGMVREIEKRSVQVSKMNAVELLPENGQDTNDWPGRYIPIVPVIGKEVNVNGERRWTGIVRPAMDAQRSYNYMRSAQVEGVGLAPKAPFVGYAETVEGYEPLWQQSNVRNFAFLPIKAARDASGAVLPPPQRSVVEPAIQAITLAAHEADGDIKATTGIFDPSLGNLNPSDRSGKAILALQKQAEQGTSGYIDNLAQMSMLYEGKILRDLIPKVYDRPGRVVAAVGADEQRRQLMIGTPFVTEKGQPRPAQPGEPNAKTIDLKTGEYAVAVTVGKSYTTRREEGAAAMGELAQAAPQLMPIIADLWVGNMDFPGAPQMADRFKKQLPPQLQDDGDGPSPEQLQAKLAEVGQMMDLMKKELDAKNQIIQTDQVKAQGDLQKTLLQEQAETEREHASNAAKIEIEKLKVVGDLLKVRATLEAKQTEAMIDATVAELDANVALAGQREERESVSQEADKDRAFQSSESERGRQAERDAASEGRAFEADQAERGRMAEREARESEQE
jgi:hypothetical protein